MPQLTSWSDYIFYIQLWKLTAVSFGLYFLLIGATYRCAHAHSQLSGAPGTQSTADVKPHKSMKYIKNPNSDTFLLIALWLEG